jgi:iron complex transport system substrate-binding protein
MKTQEILSFRFVICLVFVNLFFSCSNPIDQKNEINSSFGEQLTIEYAESFQIVKHENYTEILVLDPISKEVLYKYGVGEDIPSDLTSIGNLPKRVVAMSATHIGMLEALNLTEYIVGVSDKKYICSEKVRNYIEQGEIRSMGELGVGDVEAFLAVEPDLIMFSGFDPKAPILKKLNQVGKSTFINHDWKETHPLGRAEWIKVFGVIFQKQKEANAYFDSVKVAYDKLKTVVEFNENNRQVLVGTPYGDEFNAPAGQSYMAKILADAGINYLFKGEKGVGSLSYGLEDLIMNYGHADIWLNVNANSHDEVLNLNPKFSLMKSFKNNEMYSYISNVNCFWELAAVNPHWLLHDLIKIANPDRISSPFYFYNKLE